MIRKISIVSCVLFSLLCIVFFTACGNKSDKFGNLIQGFQKEIKYHKESSCLLDSVFFCIAFIFSFIGYSFIIYMFITIERNIKIIKSVFKHNNSSDN